MVRRKHDTIKKKTAGPRPGEIEKCMFVQDQHAQGALESEMEHFGGLLYMSPAWVPRSWLVAAGRTGIRGSDLGAFGSLAGTVGERWCCSTTEAANDNRHWHEGLSPIELRDGKLILLKNAVEMLGPAIVGRAIWELYKRWPVYSKYFDFYPPIPYHIHQMFKALMEMLGLEYKPEMYFWPRDKNPFPGLRPTTHIGFKEGTRPEDIMHCLDREKWGKGHGNNILSFCEATYLRLNEGACVPTGIGHDPGSRCTWEPQWGSDVFGFILDLAFNGSMVPWELVIKDVAPAHHNDPEWMANNLFDWSLCTDPKLVEKAWCYPKVVDSTRLGSYDRIVCYGVDRTDPKGNTPKGGFSFVSSREMMVVAGDEMVIQGQGAAGCFVTSGAAVMQVRGCKNPFPVFGNDDIGFKDFTKDEPFITAQADGEGIVVRGLAPETRILRYHGPEEDQEARKLAVASWGFSN